MVATDTGLLGSNESTFAMQVFPIAEDALALWDTVPCIPGTTVPAGEARTFAWTQIYGYTPARTRYVLMWWKDGACSFGFDRDPRGRLIVTK